MIIKMFHKRAWRLIVGNLTECSDLKQIWQYCSLVDSLPSLFLICGHLPFLFGYRGNSNFENWKFLNNASETTETV